MFCNEFCLQHADKDLLKMSATQARLSKTAAVCFVVSYGGETCFLQLME